jgi:hypothetical protein
MLKFCKGRFLSLVSFLLLFAIHTNVSAQAELLPIDHHLQLKLGKRIYFDTARVVHTSFQRYITNEITGDSMNRDSLFASLYPTERPWMNKNWLYRKLFTQHLVEAGNDDYSFYLDFMPDMQVGKQGGNNLWLNTRGIELAGTIGKKFAFTSHFYEDQGKFADYYTNYANQKYVIPGQGRARPFKSGAFDYGYSGGTISYTPVKYVNFQVGYDKNFIGDGYRSLLLSDNAFNYPFLKVTGTLGQVRYMAMYAQLIDFSLDPLAQNTVLPKKNAVFHYLSWNATKRLSLGLFENIMWAPRGTDFSYVNPIMFLRPTEFANGSPDKALIGLNASYKIADRYVAYGQLMINEFTAKEVFAGNGYWANKLGGQIGVKGFDVFKVKNLNAQLEMNSVRPYSYSARDQLLNYGHYQQPLAHPFGANFTEYLGIANYRYNRLDLRMELMTATYGLDINGLNYGKDIYKSYDTRANDYDVHIGNGLKTKLRYLNTTVAYILNPKNNLRVELGYINRREKNLEMNDNQQVITIGLRSSFRNLYTDF